MTFLKYPKIYPIGAKETLGILDKPVYVQEKLDGFSASIWLGDDGTLRCGSKNQEMTDLSFQGLPAFLKSDAAQDIHYFLLDKSNLRLYGEWLTGYSITEYKPECYKQFYLFDIYDALTNRFWSPNTVRAVSKKHNINMVNMTQHACVYNLEELKQDFVGKSRLTVKLNNGEGSVVKSRDGNWSAKIDR